MAVTNSLDASQNDSELNYCRREAEAFSFAFSHKKRKKLHKFFFL